MRSNQCWYALHQSTQFINPLPRIFKSNPSVKFSSSSIMFVPIITTHAEIHEHDNVLLLYSPPLLPAANYEHLYQMPQTHAILYNDTHISQLMYTGFRIKPQIIYVRLQRYLRPWISICGNASNCAAIHWRNAVVTYFNPTPIGNFKNHTISIRSKTDNANPLTFYYRETKFLLPRNLTSVLYVLHTT